MSELSQKSRFAIDLDDLERQLRNMQTNEARQPAADPLAELARLVGQDDPLKDVFAPQVKPTAVDDAPAPPHGEDQFAVPPEDLRGSVDEFDAIFDREMLAQPHRQPQAGPARGLSQDLAGEFAPHSARDFAHDPLQDDIAREVLAAVVPEARAEAGHAGASQKDPLADLEDLISRDLGQFGAERATPAPHAAQGDFAALAATAAGAGAVGAAIPPDEAQATPPPAAGRSAWSKGAITAGVLLMLGVIGIGGAAVWRGGKPSDGQPPVIKADPGPTRVQPQNQGGAEIPDQNKQIFERAGAPKPADTKVVNRDEQPVDVQAVVRSQPRVILPGANGAPSPDNGQGAAAPQAAPATAPINGLGEPRRVRTIAIRPDGTVINAPQTPSPAVTTPAAPAPTATASTPAAPPAAANPPAATAPAGIQRQQAPRIAAPAPAAETPAARPAPVEPPAAAQPRPAPQPTRVAVAPPASATTTDAPAAGGGGFAVQLAAPGSESEARAIFASLQRRFPDELGNQRPLIRKAEVNGREVFRLRVGPMSREGAADLCNRLKGRGGQCFIAGN
jgi:hypothetical protein